MSPYIGPPIKPVPFSQNLQNAVRDIAWAICIILVIGFGFLIFLWGRGGRGEDWLFALGNPFITAPPLAGLVGIVFLTNSKKTKSGKFNASRTILIFVTCAFAVITFLLGVFIVGALLTNDWWTIPYGG